MKHDQISPNNACLCDRYSVTRMDSHRLLGCFLEHVSSKKPGSRFNIKMISYPYRKSHCGDLTTVLSPQFNFLHNIGETTSLYWIGPCSSSRAPYDTDVWVWKSWSCTSTARGCLMWLLWNPGSREVSGVIILKMVRCWLRIRGCWIQFGAEILWTARSSTWEQLPYHVSYLIVKHHDIFFKINSYPNKE